MRFGYTYITEIKTSRRILYYGGKKTASEFRPKYFGSGRVVKLIRRTGKAELSVILHAWHETLEELNEAEKRLIADLRSMHGKACVNVNHGGDGFTPEMSRIVQNTPTFRAKRDAARRKFWEDPEARKAAAKRALATIDRHPEIKVAFLRSAHTPEARRKGREANARLWKDPEHRAARVAVLQSEERRKAVSVGQTAAWLDPEIRARRGGALSEKHKDVDFLARRKKAIQEANQRPELRAKRKKTSLAMWSDPEVKAARVVGMQAAMNTPEAIAKRSAAIRAAWARRKAAASA